MKHSKLKARLQKDRPKRMISLRIPEDVLEDLKLVAPRLGFSGYQPLIRAYIGQGLRVDLAKFEEDTDLMQLIESLRKHGVKDDIIASAMADIETLKKAA